MKDINTAYCDGHCITMYDSEGNTLVTPLNLDHCIKDVRYECGSLVFTDINNQEIRIGTDNLVDDSLSRISGYYWNGYGEDPAQPLGNSTNAILARITAKVLGEFLQTPDGVRAIEKELNNYFNGTS